MAKPTVQTPPPPPAAEQTTTVSGYAISILAFIPVNKKDLARQIEIPTILQAVMTGEKDITALAPYLYGTEVRNNFVNKRYPASEAREMLATPAKGGITIIGGVYEKNQAASEQQEPTTDKPELEGE